MKYSMTYTLWSLMNEEQQAAHLKDNKLEISGYTLVGPFSQPSHVEFQDATEEDSK